MFPSCNPSVRAGHLAMAPAAPFLPTDNAPAPEPLPTWPVYLARTGERLAIRAESWREALALTQRADACLVEPAPGGGIEITFDPDDPQIIASRTLAGGLAKAVALLDAMNAHHR